MKSTQRELFKSMLMRAGIFHLARYVIHIVRAKLGHIHEIDYVKFISSHEKLRIADTGANTGQSLIAFRRKYPRSAIHCFEPNPACHSMLYNAKKIVGGDITIHKFGIGSAPGQIEFFTPVMNNSIDLLQEGSFERNQFSTEATLKRIGKEYRLKSRII